MALITKKPALIRNNIATQLKTAANSLTIQEWNYVVNVLKEQANLNTAYLEQLHRLLFYNWDNNTTGFMDALAEFEPQLLASVTALIDDLRNEIVNHRVDMNNPHNVTAAQIGLTPEFLQGLSVPDIVVSETIPAQESVVWVEVTGTLN